MTVRLHGYTSERDIDAMMALLSAGRLANNGSYYVHPGDLAWWLFNPPDEQDRIDNLLLMSDDTGLIGWALASPDFGSLDMFVHPRVRRTDTAHTFYSTVRPWFEEHTKPAAEGVLRSVWNRDDDVEARQLYTDWGWVPDAGHYVHYQMDIPDVLSINLPDGYALANATTEAGRQARFQATHQAFGTHRPLSAYLDKSDRFVQSRVFVPENNLALIGPDGGGAAGCTVWLDPLTGVGLFEPVGVVPAHQRKGLGVALLRAGLDRMRAAGMRSAIVSTDFDNPAANALYRSAGFDKAFEFTTYARKLKSSA
jgi:GNAT superfamily N-acetyltransferase